MKPPPRAEDVKKILSRFIVFAHYTVSVDGQAYQVVVAEGDVALTAASVTPVAVAASPPATAATGAASTVNAGLAGTIHQVLVGIGDAVAEGQVVCILEAMKMETEVRASSAGTVSSVEVAVGDSVSVGQTLISMT